MVQSAKEVAINPADPGSVERWRSANHEVRQQNTRPLSQTVSIWGKDDTQWWIIFHSRFLYVREFPIPDTCLILLTTVTPKS